MGTTSTTANKSHWDVRALNCTLTSPVSLPANDMITLRTTCGWVATIHKSLLCHYSTYYQVAIYGRFKEANSNHFDIELNKVSVKWLVRWLYSRQLPGSGLGIGSRSDELFQLYVFADEKDILALRRDVMTRLVQLGWDYLPYHEIALATNSLPRSAPLYRFLFEWYINHWYPHKDDPCQQGQEYEKLPKEFMHLVMCGLCERAEVLRHGKEPTCVCCHEPCGFHEHKSHDEWRETCVRFGDVRITDCPEELKPKKPDQTST